MKEISAGGVVYRRTGERIELLIIEDRYMKISLPKGKQEAGETMEETALREVIGVLIGTIMTAAIQSSTATTAITMSFIGDHLIPLTMAIAIILGSNIGTCMTALIASIGGNTASIRVAWSHIILNVGGVILFIPLIGVLALITTMISNYPPAQVAHAQTIFNVVCSLLVLPFANSFSKVIEFLIPNKKS